MKKLVKILSFFFACVCVCVLAACGNKIDIKGYLNVTPGLTSITVNAEFDASSLLEDGSAKPYINVYDEDEEYLTKENLSFLNSNYVKTQDTTVTTSIKQGTKYIVKLYVSYNSLAYELDSTEVTTLSGGDSADNPILISTKDDLESMGSYTSSYFRLENDLDLEEATLTTIFTSSKKFAGTFDGNGHTITNFKLTSTTYMGIFGYVSGGTIKNLTISNATVTLNRNETHFGFLAGNVEGATIENCTVKDSSITFTPYSSTTGNVGALCGKVSTSTITDCTVSNCSIEIVKARYQLSVGLACGSIDQKTKITNTNAEGSITATLYYNDSKENSYFNVGGFIGKDQSGINSVDSCTVTADIKVTEDTDKTTQADDQLLCVGGFVGTNQNGKMSIKNCAAIVDIEVENNYATDVYIGGFVAYAADKFDLNQVDITNCLYTAKKSGITIIYNKTINEGYKAVTDLTKWETGVEYYTKDDEGVYTLVDTEEVKTPVSKTSYYVKTTYMYAGITAAKFEITNTEKAIKNLYYKDAAITMYYMAEETDPETQATTKVKTEDASYVFTSGVAATDLEFLPASVKKIVEDAKSAE